MKLKLMAVALVAAFATNANANNYSVGDLSVLGDYTASTSAFAKGSSFSDTYSFTLSGGSNDFSGFASSAYTSLLPYLTTFTAVLTGPGGYSDTWTLFTMPKHGEVRLSNDTMLSSGSYLLTLGGTVGNVHTASYSVNLTASPVPVPEPETYGMLMAGLGLMGFIARRRTKI